MRSSGLLEKLGVGGSSWEERENNRYSANLVPVENQLLSGSELEEQDNLVDEFKEEFVEENDYEEELEYVELESSKEEFKNKKQLYLENDSPEDIEDKTSNENQIEEEKNQYLKSQSRIKSKLASKRPVQRAKETLDIEPLDPKNEFYDQKESEKFEIDDPW